MVVFLPPDLTRCVEEFLFHDHYQPLGLTVILGNRGVGKTTFAKYLMNSRDNFGAKIYTSFKKCRKHLRDPRLKILLLEDKLSLGSDLLQTIWEARCHNLKIYITLQTLDSFPVNQIRELFCLFANKAHIQSIKLKHIMVLDKMTVGSCYHISSSEGKPIEFRGRDLIRIKRFPSV